LKIGLKYEYLDDIESNILFQFPISNHDAIRHIKNITKDFFLNNNFQMLKNSFKIIIIFGVLKSS
jgi:hypothetical protein